MTTEHSTDETDHKYHQLWNNLYNKCKQNSLSSTKCLIQPYKMIKIRYQKVFTRNAQFQSLICKETASLAYVMPFQICKIAIIAYTTLFILFYFFKFVEVVTMDFIWIWLSALVWPPKELWTHLLHPNLPSTHKLLGEFSFLGKI